MPDLNEREQEPPRRAVLRLRSQEDLVAAVPHLLGFHPEDSLVIVCLAGDGPVLRIDEPAVAEEIPDIAEALVVPFREQEFGRGGIAFIHFTSAVEGGHHRALNDLLVARFSAECGLDPVVTLEVADGVVCDLASGAASAVTASAGSRMAAEFAFAGKPQPRLGRGSYAAELRTDPAAQAEVGLQIASIEPALRPKLEAPLGRASERDWVAAAVARFIEDPVPMTPAGAGRLLVDLDEPDLRLLALMAIERAEVHRHVALWEDLSRRTPDDRRAGPLALLAMSHWVAGDGAAAWTAIDAVEAGGHRHPLADLAGDLLKSATPPTRWVAVQAALGTADSFLSDSPHDSSELAAARARISRGLGAKAADPGVNEEQQAPVRRNRPHDGPTL